MALLAAYVVPHPPIAVSEVGRGEEKKIQPTLDSFDNVAREISDLAPETLIITSPHSVMYSDYFHISPGSEAEGSLAQFRAPGVQFNEEYDTVLANRINDICMDRRFPAGFEGERDPRLDHGTMVPLYFIRKRFRDFMIIRIGLSGLPLETHREFGKIISQAIEDTGRRTVIIASGDLSHCQKEDGPYGFSPEGPEYDSRLMETFKKGDLSDLFSYPSQLLEDSMECGHRSFCIMAGALEDKKYSCEVLSHEATFGVGYGIVKIKVE